MVQRARGGKLKLRRSTQLAPPKAAKLAEIQQLMAPLKIEHVAPSSLIANPNNARVHSKRQLAQLKASIRLFGFIVPVLIDEAGKVLAGHGRLAAALELDMPSIPAVRITHLTADQKRAYALADNRLAELSGWDFELLRIEFDELSVLDNELLIDVTGFDTAFVDRLLATPAAEEKDPVDDLPQLLDRPVSQPGDLYVLGAHRVLCGNACDPDSYTPLLGRSAVQMVLTDPPYNVKIARNVTSRPKHREFAMASGEMMPPEYIAFLEQALRLMHHVSCDGAIHFVFMDWRHMLELQTAAFPVYGAPKQVCVWAKDQAGMGSFYRSQHELVFVFKVGDGPHINNFGLGERGRYRTNVWQYAAPRPNTRGDDGAAEDHPTVKPVAMFVDAIKDCSHRGGIILDPFGGSGTTLIAAERTKRYARLIELDPLYVDLIVRRWQALTGLDAIHAGSGRTFAHLEREREEARIDA
jgi:DNA modification methylase